MMGRAVRGLGSLVSLAACVALLLAAAPAEAQTDETAASEGATFAMALTGRPLSFDPREVVRSIESRVVNNLFEGLYMPPVGEGPPVPGVAISHEVSDDGTLYTFHLRPDARWSNGDPVTAHDFTTALRRVLEPGNEYPYTYLALGIRGGRDYHVGAVGAEGLGLRAVDDQTLQIELEEPIPFFIDLTSFCTFFPVHTGSINAHGDDAFTAENLVSNGPYALSAFDPETELLLERNANYWDAEAVQIGRVSMRIFPTEEASLEAYLAGEVEWLGELPWERLSSLRFRNDFKTHPMFGTYYFRVNVTDPVLADPRVRQALSLAIDRDAICRHVLDELCVAANSFVPPMPAYEPMGILSYSPERARDLLFEAGYENGEGFPTVRLMYNTLELHQRVVEAIVEMWRANLNIEVELVEHSWETYLSELDNMNYHVARFGWIGDYIDPDSFLYLMDGDNPRMNGGWRNDAFDNIMRQAAVERDEVQRNGLFRAAEAILLNELPVIPLFYYTQYQLIRPEIQGFEMNLRDVHLVRYLSRGGP